MNKRYGIWIPGTLLAVIFSLFFSGGCSTQARSGETGDLRITVNEGENWLHQYSAVINNPPQFVIWIESVEGEYQSTVFATRKIATERWMFNNGNRRMESLPVWSHRRNIRAGDGLLLPTKENPLTDGITGATPKTGPVIYLKPPESSGRFNLLLEINHSTDFNSQWPEAAEQGTEQWSGGPDGSGQPSLVYRAVIDPGAADSWRLELIGHGSADGSDGEIYSDLSGFGSALTIIDDITVSVVK